MKTVYSDDGYTGGGLYRQREDHGFLDFDIILQIDKHLLEFGAGYSHIPLGDMELTLINRHSFRTIL